MTKILVFDPGESTGWVCYNTETNEIIGGTATKCHMEVGGIIQDNNPDLIVLERFNLYPSVAKSLAWNTFYPCEVIGVIKYIAQLRVTPVVEQAPSVKKYAGGLDAFWTYLRKNFKVTEHTKDAYLHLKYYLRSIKKSSPDVAQAPEEV